MPPSKQCIHASLLTLVLSASVLGGCTLTFGTTGALIDRSAARQPVARYTLDAPPPYNTPVELVTRTGASVTGRWLGVVVDTAGTRSVVLGQRRHRFELGTHHVVQVRGRPAPARATVPLLLIGMVIDGLIVLKVNDNITKSCAYQGCGE